MAHPVIPADESTADKILAKAYMYLVQTAAADGVITEEEQQILDTFEVSMKNYKIALKQAYEDDIITKEEREKLQKIKEIIIGGGRIVADAEDGISKDEMNLLISVMLSLEVPKADD